MQLWKVLLLFIIVLCNLEGTTTWPNIGQWSQWSACSVTCGSGTQEEVFQCAVCKGWWRRTRTCITPCAMHSATNQGVLQRSKENVALKHHSIEMLVSSEIQCALRCQRSSECQSFNIGSKKDQIDNEAHASLICQLNNATADSEPENLVHKNGYHYYSFISKHFGN